MKVHKVFWHLLWISWEHFSGPKRLLKTQIFQKKRQPFQWRKDFGLHFPVLSNMWYVKKLFSRSANSFDYYCGTYKSIFFGLERLLKTKFLKKKANFPVKKNELTSFNSFYRLWKTSRNNLQVSTSYSYQYCVIYRRIFLGRKRLLKTQTFEKRQAFHWKKIWRLYSRFIERHKAQETKYKGPQAIFIIAL